MEVKLVASFKNFRHLEVWYEDKLVATVDKSLFKKKIQLLTATTNIHEQFEILEKKIAYQYAIWLLSRRSYSTWEIKKKLKEKLIRDSSVTYVIEKLSSFLNDEELCLSILRTQSAQGKGERVMIQKISQRLGISWDQAKQAVESVYNEQDQIKKAVFLLQKKARDQGKALRFLLGRGFPYSIALQAIRNQRDLDSEEMQ